MVVVVVGRRRVVQGSGAAVLDRLGRARLEGLLQFRHVVGVLDAHAHKKTRTFTHTHAKEEEKSQLAVKKER